MPLLKCGADISPPSIFELPEGDFPWWVAHTRSRQEKALGRYLLPLGVAFYLPQFEKQIRRSGRTFLSYLPLFPGYVFFRGSACERQKALRSNLIVRTLEVADQARLSQELRQLRVLQESGASLVPCDALEPGDGVRVTSGPFQGYVGVVARVQTRLRLMVSVTMLRKTVAVEFNRSVLAPLPSSGRSSGAQQTAVA